MSHEVEPPGAWGGWEQPVTLKVGGAPVVV